MQRIIFKDLSHKNFYDEMYEKVRFQDCYHQALIYTLGICEDTRRQFERQGKKVLLIDADAQGSLVASLGF